MSTPNPVSHKSEQDSAEILNLAGLLSAHMPPSNLAVQDWAPIVRTASRHKLGPLLEWTLGGHGFVIPDQAARKLLQNDSKIADFTCQILLENQARIASALAQAGIPVIWLKGIALAQTVYVRPHLRPMEDLDLLVPYEQREAAFQTLLQAGYEVLPPDDLSEKMGAQHAPHHYNLVGGPGLNTKVELHFRLMMDDRFLPLSEMEWFWAESVVESANGADMRQLKDEAHFIYLAAHAILQHGEADFRLQRYYDLHLLAQRPGFDWELAIKHARTLGWVYALERALTLTRGYFDTPIPDGVLPALQNSPAAKNIEPWTQQRWEGVQLSLNGRSLPDRLRRLFWLTFPPASYMRTRYSIPMGRALIPYYFSRWVSASRDIINAILRKIK